MSDKRKRSQNFTLEEKDKLVKILAMYKDTILNKRTDGTTNEAKTKAWVSVAARFNSSATTHRSKESLLRVWEKLKTEAKLYKSNLRENFNKTGGGPCITKIDPILEQVCSIMGRACTGILNINDSDADLPLTVNIENVISPLPTDLINPVAAIQQNTNSTADLVETEFLMSKEPLHDNVINLMATDDIQLNKNVAPASPISTPIWARRRRPIINQTNERTEVANVLCASYGDLNQKRLSIDELKHQLLTEEIEFKRELYQIKLKSAEKDLEIKTEVLKQIKDGKLALQSLQEFQTQQNYK